MTLIADQLLTLTVTCPNGVSTDHYVEDGSSLIIGNGHNCGLKLTGDDISPIHCVVRFNDGKVAVQDWCSKTGTFVDGSQIADEVNVAPGCELRVGGYQVVTSISDSKNVQSTTLHGSSKASEPTPEHIDSIDNKIPHHEDPAPTNYAATHKLTETKPRLDVDSRPANSDIVKAKFEIAEDPLAHRQTAAEEAPPASRLTDETPIREEATYASLESHAAVEEPEQEPPKKTVKRPELKKSTASKENRKRPALTPEQSFNQETIELLQSEIEMLQSELADRDARIEEMSAVFDQSLDPEPQIDNSETEALVARLEQLLDELERSDQRIRSLEELLLAAQESSRADLEEREQVESWLGDIEQRISVRESEWQAERDVLNQRMEELRDALDNADRQIEGSTTDESREALHESTLQNLREQNDQLHQQLADAQEHQRRLEGRLSEFETKSTEEQHDEKLDAAVRAERLKLAQERATFSRERSEMMRQLTEAEQQQAPPSSAAAADERFNAFRQTLRELHAQDGGKKPVVAKQSLGSRIADLWKRLDGPTDTD